jgi:uroporphyrinogen-III synthase
MKLDWMIPAPAQGVVMIATLEKNEEILEICKEINDEETEKCVTIERRFLEVLEGGCTAPIGALAVLRDDMIKFKGVLFSPDGENKIEFFKEVEANNVSDLGEYAANYILERGGKKMMRQMEEMDKEIQVFSTKIVSVEQTKLLDSNIGVTMSDFITIRNNRLKKIVIKNPIENVIITSQNGVEALLHNFSKVELNFKNIYCVGRRTKRLIEKKIGKVAHSENTAEKLANYLVENLKEKEVTFFCGDKRRENLPTILAENNIEVNEVICYQTLLTPKKVAEKYKGILFFSPSGIQSYLQKNSSDSKIAFCIGETTGKEAATYFKNVEVSSISTVDGVLKLVNTHFKKS